jgi:hypothetical protein
MSAAPPSRRATPLHLAVDGRPGAPPDPLRLLILDGLARGLPVRFRVDGASMAPAVRAGDVLTVAPARPADLRRGALVLGARRDGSLLLHRIVARRDAGAHPEYRLRGDRHVADDGWFGPERLPGRVVAIRRGARERALHGPWVRMRQWAWVGLLAVRAGWRRAAHRLLRTTGRPPPPGG